MAGKGTIGERSPGTSQPRAHLGRDARAIPSRSVRFFKGYARRAVEHGAMTYERGLNERELFVGPTKDHPDR